MHQEQVSMVKRIEYIDALRGFTMLLVVYHHIQFIGYGDNDFDSFNDVFIKFRMPLFFFISGWVLNNSKLTSTFQIGGFLKKKFRVQIISTCFFLFLYLYINPLVSGINYQNLNWPSFSGSNLELSICLNNSDKGILSKRTNPTA